MTLDYRFPDTGPPRAQQVAEKLAGEETFDWIELGLKLVFGIPLCFAPPLLFAGALMGRRKRWLWMWDYYPHLLLWSSIIFIPLAFWIQRHRKRELVWDAGNIESDGGLGLLADLVLVGPKLIWSLVDQYHERDEPNDELRAMAAGIVVELLDINRSIPLSRLVADGRRTEDEARRALRYLEHRRWIAIPRTRERVWLNDSIRKELAHLQ